MSPTRRKAECSHRADLPWILHSWIHAALHWRALCHITDGLLKSHFNWSDIRFIASVLSPGNVSQLQSRLDVKRQRGETQTGCNWHYFHSFSYNIPLLLCVERAQERRNHSSNRRDREAEETESMFAPWRRGQKPNILARCEWLITSFAAAQPLVIRWGGTGGVCTPKRIPNERQKAACQNISTKRDDSSR